MLFFVVLTAVVFGCFRRWKKQILLVGDDTPRLVKTRVICAMHIFWEVYCGAKSREKYSPPPSPSLIPPYILVLAAV